MKIGLFEIGPILLKGLILCLLATHANASTRAYVTNTNSNTVSVIDVDGRAVIDTIPVGLQPIGIAVDEASRRVYVANANSATVSVIDARSNTVIATIPVSGQYPEGVAVAPAGGKIYVTVQSPVIAVGTVSVIDPASNTETASIRVGLGPQRIVISPDASRAYTANFGGSVSVINLLTNTVTSTIQVPRGPIGIALNASGSRAYLTNQLEGTLSVIDTGSNQIISVIQVGLFPRGIVINQAGNLAYVTNINSNTISVVDIATNAVIATLTAAGSGPQGIAIDDGGIEALIANTNTNTLSVLNLLTNQFAASIPVGTSPSYVALLSSNELTPDEALAATRALVAGIYAERSVPATVRSAIGFQFRLILLNLDYYRTRQSASTLYWICRQFEYAVSTMETYVARGRLAEPFGTSWIYRTEQISAGIGCN